MPSYFLTKRNLYANWNSHSFFYYHHHYFADLTNLSNDITSSSKDYLTAQIQMKLNKNQEWYNNLKSE